MMFSNLSKVLIGLASLSFLTVLALPVTYESNELYAREFDKNHLSLMKREIWGKGKYQIDISIYHSDIKPKFKSEFQSKYGKKKFDDYCGTNPDFMIDKNGDVTASAVGKKNSNCNNKNFPALALGDIVLAAQPKSRSPSPEPSTSKKGRRELTLEKRDIWGKGQYQIDISIYHSTVKPKFKSEFQKAYGKKFTDFCGSNPDFMIDKNGDVSASGVGKSKTGSCNTKTFPALPLGSIVLAAQPKSRSPSPEPSTSKKGRRELTLEKREIWGKGKYQIDISIYHSTVKPKFKSEFQKAYGKKFTDFCGSNPDFMIDKNGDVSASGVGKSKTGSCNTKTFPALPLGDIVLAAQPKERSPSPSPDRSRSPSPSRKH